MATIEKRGNLQWRAKVRRCRPDGTLVMRTKTFDNYGAAKSWAEMLDGRISADEYIDKSRAQRATLGDLIQRYLDEITPTKKGGIPREECPEGRATRGLDLVAGS